MEVVLRFTVGKEPGDEEKPRVTSEYGSGCTVSANNTEECDTQKWHMKFNVKVMMGRRNKQNNDKGRQDESYDFRTPDRD